MSSTMNKTNTERGKTSKQFSLFSVVQFPNEVCTTTSGTYSNGTCITSSECTSRGGTAQGSCAAGFGVCCIYTFSDSGSRITRNTSYIVNPSYPSTFTPTSTPTTLTYTIEKESCDICRIRLDYEVFQLTTPLTDVALGTNTGACNTDFMTITTTAHTVTSDTTGNYGNYPYLCGRNGGLHSYIDMSCTCSDEAELSFTLGDNVDNLWKIKVSQISCNDDNVANQEGCFQYFTGETGTISSYNLAGAVMLACQNYAVCIRPEEGMCCIEYTATTWELARGDYDGYMVGNIIVAAITGNCVTLPAIAHSTYHCAGAFNCYVNYVIIPEVQSSVALGQADGTAYHTHADGYDRFCGSKLTPQGWVTAATEPHQPVISCEKPFRLQHVTGVCATSGSGGAAMSSDATANSLSGGVGILNPADATTVPKGFELTYRQLPGNC